LRARPERAVHVAEGVGAGEHVEGAFADASTAARRASGYAAAVTVAATSSASGPRKATDRLEPEVGIEPTTYRLKANAW
jgi:hypothetical protein